MVYVITKRRELLTLTTIDALQQPTYTKGGTAEEEGDSLWQVGSTGLSNPGFLINMPVACPPVEPYARASSYRESLIKPMHNFKATALSSAQE